MIFAAGLIASGAFGYWLASSRIAAPPAPQPQAAAAPAADSDELKLDESYLDTVGIKTEPVTSGNLSLDVLAPGLVSAAPDGIGVVTAHTAGTVIRLTKRLGDAVQAGETVAILESREANAMVADRTVAESKAALARSQLAREQELFNQRVTPRQDLERAQAELAVAEAEVRRAREAATAAHVTSDGQIAVISPLPGRVTAVSAALGTFVQPETELFRIADPRFIQIEAAVTAADALRIAVGDPAKVTTPSGAMISGTVRSTIPAVNEQTRAATVVIALTGTHEPLSPGEAVQVDLMPKNAAPGGVLVPEDAVQNVGGRNVVFVRTPTGFKVRPVVIGSRGGGRVTILSGVAVGETIATANAFFLKAELGKGAGEEE
jgi:cobalt-zinc-cadmium efflux system membrane fusion protein